MAVDFCGRSGLPQLIVMFVRLIDISTCARLDIALGAVLFVKSSLPARDVPTPFDVLVISDTSQK